jgi:hypothetical protein
MDAPKEKLTPFEAKLELTNITQDPHHPLYDLYRRQDRTALEYVQHCYESAYGTGKVQIGEGIEIVHKHKL